MPSSPRIPNAIRLPGAPRQVPPLPGDLIQPVLNESYVAYFRPTPKPFYFFHSSHIPGGSTVPAHRHPCVALHGCLQGPLTLSGGGDDHVLDAGIFCLVGPGVLHYWHNQGPHTAANVSLLIDHRQPGSWPAASGVPDLLRELTRLVRGLHRFRAAADAEMKHTFWQLADHLMADRPRKQAATTGLLLTLLGRVVESLGKPEEPAKAPTGPAEEIRRLLLTRVCDRVTIEEVAREVHLSPTRAKEVFRATYGCGILAYFNQLKLWQAKRLLGASSLTVEQVSRKLGFSSPSYFSRVFQRYTGESPTDYRSQNQG
jgi:AraC-like DNA-binding protein